MLLRVEKQILSYTTDRGINWISISRGLFSNVSQVIKMGKPLTPKSNSRNL